jgi:hypothetical protein
VNEEAENEELFDRHIVKHPEITSVAVRDGKVFRI